MNPDYVRVADFLFGLSVIISEHGNVDVALSLLDEVIKIRKKVIGKDDASVADALYQKGLVYLDEAGDIEA